MFSDSLFAVKFVPSETRHRSLQVQDDSFRQRIVRRQSGFGGALQPAACLPKNEPVPV